MERSLEELIWRRACDRCEYCQVLSVLDEPGTSHYELLAPSLHRRCDAGLREATK